jgi:hypothetical protein
MRTVNDTNYISYSHVLIILIIKIYVDSEQKAARDIQIKAGSLGTIKIYIFDNILF